MADKVKWVKPVAKYARTEDGQAAVGWSEYFGAYAVKVVDKNDPDGYQYGLQDSLKKGQELAEKWLKEVAAK